MARGDSSTHTQTAQTLLIVDDEPSLRFSIGEWARDAGFRALEAATGRDAIAQLQQSPVDGVLLDLKLGDEDGLQVLKRLREEDPQLPVVMLTGHGTLGDAVRATKLGAFDFMPKPPDLEHLEVVLRRALEHARLQREVEHLRKAREAQPLIGDSPGLKRVLQRLDKVAKSSTATVLIHGETGSGKELMAQYLHAKSARAGEPFVTVNCAAIPENLLESELYGYEKGAFTDAKRSKQGLFEVANRGTVLLDEIGEMSLALQAKLLRVLETRTFRRVGGHTNITVDVRVVASTHNDLRRKVGESKFREDLFFRLNVVPIDMPPLRDRPEDIAILAEYYIDHFCRPLARLPARLHPEALRAMVAYAWPGNVRELKNVIERVILLEAEDEILPQHLPPELAARGPLGGEGTPAPFPPGVVRPLVEIERLAIEHSLHECQGNKTQAAQKLGISRQTLRTKLKEFRIEDDAEGGVET
ncbi:MAG TPA: sigma-54 dependent transcriptional regulator [Candidatus Limnocylindria bacterium]|nr:sigma-54 dependent transcriptional regulator [Candidatus Limnocylindria bacterium]